MRDPERIEPMLDLIREVWKTSPDMRLGQLLSIATRYAPGYADVFYVEDDRLAEGLEILKR